MIFPARNLHLVRGFPSLLCWTTEGDFTVFAFQIKIILHQTYKGDANTKLLLLVSFPPSFPSFLTLGSSGIRSFPIFPINFLTFSPSAQLSASTTEATPPLRRGSCGRGLRTPLPGSGEPPALRPVRQGRGREREAILAAERRGDGHVPLCYVYIYMYIYIGINIFIPIYIYIHTY